jgi:hypothetical protein
MEYVYTYFLDVTSLALMLVPCRSFAAMESAHITTKLEILDFVVRTRDIAVVFVPRCR